MSSLDEVRRAVDVASTAGTGDVAVLHCVSAYPAPVDALNLRAVATLASSLGVPAGFSDHSTSPAAPVAAVALGACLYERHLVLDGDAEAIDGPVSSTPAQLKALIQAMDEARRALGNGQKSCAADERPNLVPSRRGLYAARSLAAGTRLAAADVAVLRPATSLAPFRLRTLVGSVLARAVEPGAPLSERDFVVERAS
jgi:sialic acid synthase SpsE